MRNRSIAAVVRQSIGWSAALAGLTLALLTGACRVGEERDPLPNQAQLLFGTLHYEQPREKLRRELKQE